MADYAALIHLPAGLPAFFGEEGLSAQVRWAQARKPPRTPVFDQGFKRLSNRQGPFLHARDCLRFCEQVMVKGGTHAELSALNEHSVI
jgi:hypothetical protein